jgi:protein gp37
MLKKRSGNLYEFVTHTWNPVKGECPYHCSYCYVGRTMERYGKKQNPLHLDEKELKTNLGAGNFVFVCSGCDLFHPDVPDEWIYEVLKKTIDNWDNSYLWHTKNPSRLLVFSDLIPKKDCVCVTIESNIPWPGISKAPQPSDRVFSTRGLSARIMITVEPILDFDALTFSEMILSCRPVQVNIGADSGHNNLPEPSEEKVVYLLELLAPYTKIHLKKNLRRILPESRHYGNA